MESASSASSGWDVYKQLTTAEFELFKGAGIDPLHAQLLHNRGIETPSAMRAFLDAHYSQTLGPFTLIDMRTAVTRIQQALTTGEHITVFGDYDADGVTSSALLTRALRKLKLPDAPLDHYIPSRLQEGCGLNIPALDILKVRGTSLIITTDCASSDVEQVIYARKLGIDVIITDHHHPPESRPDAYALVNPWRPDSTYGERYLCGAGVAFKLVQALYQTYQRPAGEEQELLDLMAFGSIADIAPLLGENHTLVRLGMQQLNQTQKPGLLAIIRRANLQTGKIRERDIAFSLAPRINAAGRMKHANIAFDLLTTDDEAEASALAEELEQLNLSRQRQTEELINQVRLQAKERPDDPVVLVSGENWPEGIIGLVAGKLAEEINRPVLVLSKGPQYSRGSARSQDGFNIILALRAAPPDLLERYGGHAQAAGFTIANERIEELREHLLKWNGRDLPSIDLPVLETEIGDLVNVIPDQESNLSSSTAMIDLVFTKFEKISYHTYNSLRELSPFGASNPEPVFRMDGLQLFDRWTSGIDGRNLRLRLGAGQVQRIGTLVGGGKRIQEFPKGSRVNVIFRLEAAWNPAHEENKQDIWLKILHIELASV